jgi:hypothetical protein
MIDRLRRSNQNPLNSMRILSRCGLFLLCASQLFAAPSGDSFWPPITSQTRPWAFWWWMGSAVDETNLTKEMQRYHDAGMGGVHIIPIYGVQGGDSNYIKYLSPRWMELMGYSVSEARRLGMDVDMTLGTGWCLGGPTVSDEDANASAVVRTFNLATGEKLTEKFKPGSVQTLMAFSTNANTVDLMRKISADGAVDWSAPAGSWKVYAISQKPSGQKVKRPAPGGEGWMLNPFYPKAVRDWLPWFDAAFRNYHGPRPRAVFQDSYEYRTDWSPDFFAQFQKRRGYKLQNELPALFGTSEDEHAARVKYDYRRTASEVMADESEPAWISWGHKNGFISRYQAHGSPGNWLDLYADADIPETEMFHNDRSVFISKFASSAAHVAGHQLTSAETGTWMVEHFTETLGEMKNLVDDMFLAGVNHVVYHGLCYSPDEAGWPGWHFYASTEMNPRNSIWHDARALNDYIARVQSVLQSGAPDNDILLYWPVADFWSDPAGRVQTMSVSRGGWFEGQNIGKVAHELWNRGYAFDYVSDAQLLKAKVKRGSIQTPGGDYQVIVVPECKYMPLETFKQLEALAKKGAVVIFQNDLPKDIPGAGDLAAREKEFQKIKNSIPLEEKNIVVGKLKEAEFGKGGILVGDLGPLLRFCQVPRESMTDSGLYFIRRSVADGGYYFIVNRSATNYDGWVTLDKLVASAACFDPSTGMAGILPQREMIADRFIKSRLQYRLQLAPGESLVVRGWVDKKVEGGLWEYRQAKSSPMEISGTWNVKFLTGGPALLADSQITKLASWTTFADTNAQAFGGTARYSITFDAPRASSADYLLNLGDVRQSARVRLNGEDYGVLITPPFQVAVDNLKPTGNQLEIEVTSVDANRIRDLDRRGVKWKIFGDINVVNVDYKPFSAANWPLTDCGLLGPVTLTPVDFK